MKTMNKIGTVNNVESFRMVDESDSFLFSLTAELAKSKVKPMFVLKEKRPKKYTITLYFIDSGMSKEDSFVCFRGKVFRPKGVKV